MADVTALVNEPISPALLSRIRRNHVLNALARLDRGEQTAFAESIKYDLVFKTRRYPPKKVAGLALQALTGQAYGPYAFKGGLESACFRALQSAGFTLTTKHDSGSAPNSIATVLKEILDLQTKYSATNTPEMERRGQLIRTVLPDLIRAEINRFEPVFSERSYSFAVEGSDGMGRKAESPWVRIYDPLMSPSATSGWYLVIHFSRSGSALFLTLGCGATRYERGSFAPVAHGELAQRVEWARSLQQTPGFAAEDFSDGINLEGNDLSRQFERATAYSRAVMATDLASDSFFTALQALVHRLMDTYDAQRSGQDPVDFHHDLQASIEEAAEVISPRRTRAGQGRGLSPAERCAVELRAMEVARFGLIAAGFTNIEDTSATQSFDYEATKHGVKWLIEVKGTSSSNCEQFLLTANELELHRNLKGTTALALVSQIQLMRAPVIFAIGGSLELLSPWDHETWSFEPTSFKAVRKASTKPGQR